jgi:hypothetical protein
MIFRGKLLHNLINRESLVDLALHLALNVFDQAPVELVSHVSAYLVKKTRQLHQL